MMLMFNKELTVKIAIECHFSIISNNIDVVIMYMCRQRVLMELEDGPFKPISISVPICMHCLAHDRLKAY